MVVRDARDFDVLKSVQMIHAMVHKRLFVFYSNQSCCDLITSTILNVFSFDHDSDMDSFEQEPKKV